MKEILEKMYDILMLIHLSAKNKEGNEFLRAKADIGIEARLMKLKEMIDESPDDEKLEDKLGDGEKGFLRKKQ